MEHALPSIFPAKNIAPYAELLILLQWSCGPGSIQEGIVTDPSLMPRFLTLSHDILTPHVHPMHHHINTLCPDLMQLWPGLFLSVDPQPGCQIVKATTQDCERRSPISRWSMYCDCCRRRICHRMLKATVGRDIQSHHDQIPGNRPIQISHWELLDRHSRYWPFNNRTDQGRQNAFLCKRSSRNQRKIARIRKIPNVWGRLCIETS